MRILKWIQLLVKLHRIVIHLYSAVVVQQSWCMVWFGF